MGKTIEPFVGYPEVQDLTNLSRKTLQRAVASGLLPHYRLPSGTVRFRLSEVARAIQAYSNQRWRPRRKRKEGRNDV